VDGSSFTIDGQTEEKVRPAPPVLAAVPLSIMPHRQAGGDKAHWLSVAGAAIAHVALIAFMFTADSDAMGDEGVALETIAVSIVAAVPTISAPETKPADNPDVRPDADDQQVESAPQQQQEQPKEAARPTLTLDLPPEPELQADVPTLPARQPDQQHEPREVTQAPPAEIPVEKPADTSVSNAAASAVVTGAIQQLSSAEAAPGIVRAYARQISGVLDRNKPRAKGLTGEVKVQFVVGSEGRTQTAKLLASSGNQRLDDLVLGAVAKMEFPAPPREMSVSQRTFNVPFAYRIAR